MTGGGSEEEYSSVQFSPLTDWGGGGMTDYSAAILDRRFLQEVTVGSSGMGSCGSTIMIILSQVSFLKTRWKGAPYAR